MYLLYERKGGSKHKKCVYPIKIENSSLLPLRTSNANAIEVVSKFSQKKNSSKLSLTATT